MQITRQSAKDVYTETEAAEALGISLSTLHQILDEHVFNDGTPRPERVDFTSSDLVLLEFWREMIPNAKVVRMPRRY